MNVLLSDRLRADITGAEGKSTVSDIRNNGSGYGYDDGLPLFWMNCLPFTATVFCQTNPAAASSWPNNVPLLDTGNIDGPYYIHISI